MRILDDTSMRGGEGGWVGTVDLNIYISYSIVFTRSSWTGHTSSYVVIGQRKYIHLSLIFGPASGIEPATSRSAVKRSSYWANPAAVTLADMCIWRNISPAIINDHDPKRTKWDRQNFGAFFHQFYVGDDLHFSGVVFPLVQSHSQSFSVLN